MDPRGIAPRGGAQKAAAGGVGTPGPTRSEVAPRAAGAVPFAGRAHRGGRRSRRGSWRDGASARGRGGRDRARARGRGWRGGGTSCASPAPPGRNSGALRRRVATRRSWRPRVLAGRWAGCSLGSRLRNSAEHPAAARKLAGAEPRWRSVADSTRSRSRSKARSGVPRERRELRAAS